MEQTLQIHQNQSVCRRQFNSDKVVTERRQVSNSHLQRQLTHLPFMKAVGGVPSSQLFSSPLGRLLRSCESWLPGCSAQPRLQGSWLAFSLPGGELSSPLNLHFQLRVPSCSADQAFMDCDLALPFQV